MWINARKCNQCKRLLDEDDNKWCKQCKEKEKGKSKRKKESAKLRDDAAALFGIDRHKE
jgi:hypothetical protein